MLVMLCAYSLGIIGGTYLIKRIIDMFSAISVGTILILLKRKSGKINNTKNG